MRKLNKLSLSIGFYLLMAPVLAQDPPESPIERMLQRMERRMNEMMGGDDSLFNDLLEDRFAPGDLFSGSGDAFEYYYTNNDKGRTLVVVPKGTQNNLKIKVEGNSISISGDIKTEKVEKTQYGESKSISHRSVHHSLPVPNDCKGDKNKISEVKKDSAEEIHIFFPYKTGRPGEPGLLPSQKSYAKKKKSKPETSRKQQNDPSNGSSEKEEMIPLFPEGTGDTI